MKLDSSSHIEFPLDSFLQRLELAGYYIGPGQRLRLLRLLEGAGKRYLTEPEKLKYLLCPVIAQGKADQERFYELFDQYWTEVSRPWEMPAEAKKAKREWQVPKWLLWAIAMSMISMMGWLAHKIISAPKPPPLQVFFKHTSETPGVAVMKDSVKFENLSVNYDTTGYFKWEVFGKESGKRELVDTQSHHLSFRYEKMQSGHRKEVHLTHVAPGLEDGNSMSMDLAVHCDFPPRIDSIIGKKDIEVNERVVFQVLLADSNNVTVEWDFGDLTAKTTGRQAPQSKKATGLEAVTSFSKKGQYEIKVKAIRSGLDGICEVERIHRINVGREDAYLVAKPLYLDNVDPIINFSWSTWLLLGLLGLAMIWYWVRWAVRKAPQPAPADEEADLQAAAKRFAAPDKGPYFIPFRSQEGHIRVERDLYRLADVLRQRQEGLRKEMDVPTSVKETIAGGGFPRLLTQSDRVPTEYLFLLDERSWNSHQGRLFEFMVNFLQKREVLGEVYYFNQRLHSFWNNNHPEGLTPEKLYRLHPRHRVILLSDAHALIDPNASGEQPSLRTEAKKLFFQWKSRLLITPLPVVSWTWREGTLHELFPIFPSHTGGLAAAAKFLEQGMDDDELKPTYGSWCERLQAPASVEGMAEIATEPDVNYRRWRTAADHAEYLKDHPQLFNWVKALAVYPKPDWSITLAIGRALSPLGVKVTYDNLLILSRIPWLVKGELSPRLRKDFLAGLDTEAEQLARQAVQHEMEAVEALVKGSHANREHQVELAMQNFALAPQNAESQELVRQLLALDLLSNKQLADLNRQVSPGTSERSAAPIHTFLEKNKAEEEPLAKPFLTPDFYKASLATLLYIILFSLVWKFGGTDELSSLVGENSGLTTECDEEHLHYYFFKKECVADSAVLLNNEAVNLWKNNYVEKVPPRAEETWFNDVGDKLQAALELNPEYNLALANFKKYQYNAGVRWYHGFLMDSIQVEGLEEAKLNFRAAITDSLTEDALHGLGLTHFYGERFRKLAPDSSQFVYGQILSENDSYFDSLDIYPHLQSLLSPFILSSKIKVNVLVLDADTKRPVSRVVAKAKGLQWPTDANGRFQFESELGERHEYEFTKPGYDTKQQEIRATADGMIDTVELVNYEREKRVLVDNFVKTSNSIRRSLDKLQKQRKEFTLEALFLQSAKELEAIRKQFEAEFVKARAEVNRLPYKEADRVANNFINKWQSKVAALENGGKIADAPDNTGAADELIIGDWEAELPENKDYNRIRLRVLESGKVLYQFVYSDTVVFMDPITYEETIRVNSSVSLNATTLDVTTDRDGNRIWNEVPISGVKSSAYEKLIDENTLEIVIIDNGDPAQKGSTRRYKRFSSPDKDFDGIIDKNDECPLRRGSAKNNGCPEGKIGDIIKLDTDKDGVLDEDDNCPNLAGTKNGCPDLSKSHSWIEGKWTGEGKQGKPQKTWETIFEANLAAGQFKVSYPSFPCSAEWQLVSIDGSLLIFEEKLVQNAQLCQDGSRIEVRQIKGGNIQVDYYLDELGKYATAELRKEVELLHPAILALEQDMVGVQGGTFQMGCDPKYDGECIDAELPLHDVTLSDFSISKYEVTQELWEAVMGTNPSDNKDCAKCPVESVSWNNVQDFLKKLNEKIPNRNFRLPTEAEWEYAARGGHKGKQRYQYAGSDDLNAVAWYEKNSENNTRPVGQKQANELGLYDMSGNVWEWCSDWFSDEYYKEIEKGGVRNPKGPYEGIGRVRVLRGGSWNGNGSSCRVARRDWDFPNVRFDFAGFRLAQD